MNASFRTWCATCFVAATLATFIGCGPGAKQAPSSPASPSSTTESVPETAPSASTPAPETPAPETPAAGASAPAAVPETAKEAAPSSDSAAGVKAAAVKAAEPADAASSVPPAPSEPAAKADAAPAANAAPGTAITVEVVADKVSTYAPAADLTAQMDEYVKEFQEAAASQEAFAEAEGRLAKDANAAVVIALVLGLHDEDNKYRANAFALLKSLQALSEVKDLAGASAAVEAMNAALEGKGPSGELKWEKVASLPELMQVVPLIRTKLNRYVGERYFKRRASATAGYSAVLAAIAQASYYDLSETKSPEQIEQWKKFCTDMRDACAQMNVEIHKGDLQGVQTVMPVLEKSCADCHTVFYPEALGKMDEQ